MPTENINGIKINYSVSGKGKPIVFIPGLGLCGKLWQPQVEFFSRRYQVVTFDPRGHGRSEPGREDYTMSLFAEDLKGLVDALKLERVILCGLSLGSLVAQQFCMDYPGSCRGLILCGTHSHPGLKEQIVGRLVPGALKKYFRKNTLRDFAAAVARKVFTKPGQDRLRDFYAEEVIATTVEGYLNCWRAVKQFDSYRQLAKIQVPTLIYYGENDETFVKKQASFMTARIKGAHCIMMADANHIINLERPDEFNMTVGEFIMDNIPDAT
ncbi:MAG: alpha/beta hydrolase [Spirochaetales bacterium]|nr:alpha/beta hydrolase [Spirochaetales bacterium]